MKKIILIILINVVAFVTIPTRAADYIVCTECGRELWENEPFISYSTDSDEYICLCSSCIFQCLDYTDSFLPISVNPYRCEICGIPLDPNRIDYTWIPLSEVELSDHSAFLYDQYGDEYDTSDLALDIELFICDMCMFELREPFGLNVIFETPDSTAFSYVGYNKHDKTLFVTFRESGAKYKYSDVSFKEWISFCNADSLGSYFNEYIKGIYDYEEIS